MRFNTSINNVKCLEWGINANQGALFDLLYQASSWANTVILDNEVYYHVSRNLVIEELPLYYNKPDTVYRSFGDLHDRGLIVYRKDGKKDLMKLTEKGKEWNKKLGNKSEKKPKFGNESEKTRNEIRKTSDSNPTNNNINNNNIIDNNIYSLVIDYFNKKTGKKYRANTKDIQKLIKARIKEEYTIEDFYKVIDNKVKTWLHDKKMSYYLRPKTLFAGDNFQNYLNESEGENAGSEKTGGFKYSGFAVD